MRFPGFQKSLSSEQAPQMPAFPQSIGLIHFVGIGGHGVSAIASILHKLGYTIQGSDARESNNTKRLLAAGVPVFIGHDKTYVENAKLVVASAAALTIKFRLRDNIEVEAARERGIPVIHRADMLAELMRNKKAIAIGGSHGKSTTTSMVAGILESAGLMPTVMTGAVMNLYNSNSHLGTGDWVVAEADESDGSFLRLPHLVTVVTNIDSDHIIHWKNEAKTREAFVQFIRNGPFYGLGVLCIDDPGVRQIMPLLQDRNIVTYGVSEDADFQALDIDYSSGGCTFSVSFDDPQNQSRHTIGGRILVNGLGLASVQNSLAAISIACELGIDRDVIQTSLSNFPGLHHRFHHVGTVKGVTIIDDHSAHPAEIKATLEMARQAGARKIIAVNQPSGRPGIVRGWLDEYPASFDDADYIIIGQAEGGEQAAATEAQEVLVNCLRNHGRDVALMSDSAHLCELVSMAADGDFVICMGYLGSEAWAERLVGQLAL